MTFRTSMRGGFQERILVLPLRAPGIEAIPWLPAPRPWAGQRHCRPHASRRQALQEPARSRLGNLVSVDLSRSAFNPTGAQRNLPASPTRRR